MTNTERKLLEANFFLAKLEPHKPYFDFYLSAYLNAARSTAWIMRNEFQKCVGWEDWFTKVKVSEAEKILLRKINDLRIISSKQTGIKTDFHFIESFVPQEEYYSVIEKMLDEFEGQEVILTIYEKEEYEKLENNDEINRSKYSIRGKAKNKNIESENLRENILVLCMEYCSFLKKQVEECVSLFQR